MSVVMSLRVLRLVTGKSGFISSRKGHETVVKSVGDIRADTEDPIFKVSDKMSVSIKSKRNSHLISNDIHHNSPNPT